MNYLIKKKGEIQNLIASRTASCIIFLYLCDALFSPVTNNLMTWSSHLRNTRSVLLALLLIFLLSDKKLLSFTLPQSTPRLLNANDLLACQRYASWSSRQVLIGPDRPPPVASTGAMKLSNQPPPRGKSLYKHPIAIRHTDRDHPTIIAIPPTSLSPKQAPPPSSLLMDGWHHFSWL